MPAMDNPFATLPCQEAPLLIATFDRPKGGLLCLAAGNGIVAGTPFENMKHSWMKPRYMARSTGKGRPDRSLIRYCLNCTGSAWPIKSIEERRMPPFMVFIG